ncbi:MAG: ribokinase [Lachnospiraceae bacterium]|nr:ribokinase [Lachnospiraceae bacterium]
MKIYNLGSLNIDYVYQVPHFVRPGETLASSEMQTFPGGKGLNQSVALGRAGATVIHGGFIGNNDKWLADILEASKVDIRHLQTVSMPSGHAIIQVDTNGQNCILLFAGANHCFTSKYVEQALADAENGDILLLQNEINNLEIVFEIAHAKGMQIAFNPSPFDKSLLDLPLSYVDWWLCNEIEGNELTGKEDPMDIVTDLCQRFPESNVLLTLGKEGSLFKNASKLIRQPAYKTNAVDTTAAGDTFTGYFLAMAASGKDIEQALQIASLASSIAVSREGASSSIPWLEEVLNK